MERIQCIKDLKPRANLYTTQHFCNKQLVLKFFYYIISVFILTSSIYLMDKYLDFNWLSCTSFKNKDNKIYNIEKIIHNVYILMSLD